MQSKPVWKIFTKDNRYRTFNIDTEADKTWSDDFYFIQGADPQFGMMDMWRNLHYNPKTTNWDEEIRLAELAVQNINQLEPKPRFFVICGDLTNQIPDTIDELKEKQIEDFKKVFNKLDPTIPLVCVCGDHDVGEYPTVKTVKKYRDTFGDDYFSFWCGGVLFIALNSQYFKERENVAKLAEEHDRWLDEQLKSANGSPIICFSHIPWFVEDVYEKDGIFNIPTEWRIKMLDKLYAAGVRYQFCGHYHRNAGGSFKDFHVVVTSSIGKQLGTDKSGLRFVKVSRDKISHEYYDFEKMPVNVDLFINKENEN